MFKKYARAISSESERKKFFGLYLAKTILLALSLICLVVSSFIILTESEVEAITGQNDMIIFAFFFAFLILGAFALLLHINFKKKFSALLKRAPLESDMPEVVSYVSKINQEKVQEKKKTGWATWVMVLCLVLSFALIVIDVVIHPESEEVSSPIFFLATALSVVGVLVFFYARYFYKVKKLSEGSSVEQITAKEVQAIDESQGRKTKYSLESDANLQTYKYLFPTKELCEAVTSEQKKHSKRTTACILISISVCLIAVFLLTSGLFGTFNYSGFIFPVIIAVTMGSVYLVSIPYAKKVNALEKQQKELLESIPEFEKNLQIYREYESFSKVKGKILPISVAICFLGSLITAFILPNSFLSVVWSILILVALYINSAFVKKLRMKVKPIEEQIDNEQLKL